MAPAAADGTRTLPACWLNIAPTDRAVAHLAEGPDTQRLSQPVVLQKELCCLRAEALALGAAGIAGAISRANAGHAERL